MAWDPSLVPSNRMIPFFGGGKVPHDPPETWRSKSDRHSKFPHRVLTSAEWRTSRPRAISLTGPGGIPDKSVARVAAVVGHSAKHGGVALPDEAEQRVNQPGTSHS